MKNKKRTIAPPSTGKTKFRPTIYSKHPSHRSFKKNDELGFHAEKIIVGFGSVTETPVGYRRINTPEGVKNASSKTKTKQLLTAAGLNTPKYSNNIAALGDLKFPIVLKKRYGYGGEGMHLCSNKEQYDDILKKIKDRSEYFAEEVFQPNLKLCREYRVHIAPSLTEKRKLTIGENEYDLLPGEVFAMRKKMTKEGIEAGAFGRNIALGHAIFTSQFDKTEKGRMSWETIIKACVEAVKAIKLDICSVDLLYDVESKNYTILEINSASSMGKNLGEEAQRFTYHAYIAAIPLIINNLKSNVWNLRVQRA